MPEMSGKCKSNPTKTKKIGAPPPLQNPYLRPCEILTSRWKLKIYRLCCWPFVKLLSFRTWNYINIVLAEILIQLAWHYFPCKLVVLFKYKTYLLQNFAKLLCRNWSFDNYAQLIQNFAKLPRRNYAKLRVIIVSLITHNHYKIARNYVVEITWNYALITRNYSFPYYA